MAHKEFLRDINDQSRLRVLIVTERGRVKRFTVQLEALVGDSWTAVARYDTAHGFAHLDVLHPKRVQEKIQLREVDLNGALEIAFNDLLTNREAYISQYIKELSGELEGNGP